MGASDPHSPDSNESGLPSNLDSARIDDWVRERVGRQILIGCARDLPEKALALLSRYHEIRTVSVPAATTSARELESALAALLSMDPHALLFWLDAGSDSRVLADRLYQICDRAGALDSCFVALVGPTMNRATARALTFEDGFAWPGAESRLMDSILAQAEAREDARRQGASPPCYL